MNPVFNPTSLIPTIWSARCLDCDWPGFESEDADEVWTAMKAHGHRTIVDASEMLRARKKKDERTS